MLRKKWKKWEAWMLAGSLAVGGFVLSPVNADAALPDTLGDRIGEMFSNDDVQKDNTWLFGGGVETQGRFSEIRGFRNYAAHFEDYIKWDVFGWDYATETQRQRYTINVGKNGRDLVDFDEKLDGYLEALKPRSVAYLIGREDYGKGEDGVSSFKESLASVIEKVLSMTERTGFVVIQLPHAVADADAAENISLYVDAAKEVVSSLSAEDAKRVVLADHYAATDNDNFKKTCLTEDGLLNASGHYELAKLLAKATIGGPVDEKFDRSPVAWTEEKAPDTYIDEMPQVTAGNESLQVAMPGDATAAEWRYFLTVNGTEISGLAQGQTFVIDRLPANADYELVVRSGDGERQFNTATGKVAAGDIGKRPALDALQQKLADKVSDKSKPLTWLFMGDSITSGAMYSYDYDCIKEMMEKYIKEDLGRADDVILDTAVNGATTSLTIQYLDQRLLKYTPDIVAVMLGTNDARWATTDQYRQGMKTIVEKIRERNKDAVIVFRSPTPAKSPDFYQNLKGDDGIVAAMREIAEEDGNIIFVDQYTDWDRETDAYGYLFTPSFYYADAGCLHPGVTGQLRMVRLFVEACGLNENTRIANLAYKFPYADSQSGADVSAAVAVDEDAVRIDKSALQSVYGDLGQIGEVDAALTNTTLERTYSRKIGLDDPNGAVTDLPDGDYQVKLTAFIKGEEAKRVIFEVPVTVTHQQRALQAQAGERLAEYEKAYAGGSQYSGQTYAAFRDAYDGLKKALVEGVDAYRLEKLLKELEDTYKGLRLLEDSKPVESPVQLSAPAVSSAKMTATKKLLAVEIRVSRVVGADSYTVYRAQGSKVAEIGKTNAGGVAYDYNPVAGKTVSYYAVADSSNGKYTRSGKGAAKSIKLAVSTKKLAAKKVAGKTQVRLAWKKVKGAKQYLLYRSEKKDSGYTQVKVIKKANATAFVDKKVKKNKNYYYRLVVKGKQGLTGPRTSKAVKVRK